LPHGLHPVRLDLVSRHQLLMTSERYALFASARDC
jgi:hypothetical protein